MLFFDNKNVVHLDESWFYLINNKTLRRVSPRDDEYAHKTVRHKSHIPKVMIITAVARPDPDRNFDGKIGFWRFSEDYIVQRTTKNHTRGEIIQKDVSVTHETYKAMMIDNIIPAVKEKMSFYKGSRIYIQHDGAPGHVGSDNMDIFNNVGVDDGWDIEVIT